MNRATAKESLLALAFAVAVLTATSLQSAL